MARLLPDGRLGVAPGLQELLASPVGDTRARALVLALRGEEYYQLSVTAIQDPCDFVLPDRPDLRANPSMAVIPLELVRTRLQQSLQATLLTLAAVRRLCPTLPPIHVTPPPPAPSEAVAAEGGDVRERDRPVHRVPTGVRLKLWILYSGMLEQAARALGVRVIAPPAAALQANGTLRPELLEDAIHGNARYGEMVCRQLAEALEPGTGASS